jgi:hypothetical protein
MEQRRNMPDGSCCTKCRAFISMMLSETTHLLQWHESGPSQGLVTCCTAPA